MKIKNIFNVLKNQDEVVLRFVTELFRCQHHIVFNDSKSRFPCTTATQRCILCEHVRARHDYKVVSRSRAFFMIGCFNMQTKEEFVLRFGPRVFNDIQCSIEEWGEPTKYNLKFKKDTTYSRFPGVKIIRKITNKIDISKINTKAMTETIDNKLKEIEGNIQDIEREEFYREIKFAMLLA